MVDSSLCPGNVAQTNCCSLFLAKYPRFRQNHLCNPHWTLRVTIDFLSQPFKTMKSRTWICLILSGLLFCGISAYAGGTQCAATAKESAAKANEVEETNSRVTAEAEEAQVVEEAILVVETSPVSVKPPVLSKSEADSLVEIARNALDGPQSPSPLFTSNAAGSGKIVIAADAMDVAVADEGELEVHEDTQEDSETEVVEQSK